jgi:hypothetical protein
VPHPNSFGQAILNKLGDVALVGERDLFRRDLRDDRRRFEAIIRDLILSQYKRALFGRRSEKMDADQLQLLLSGNEASKRMVRPRYGCRRQRNKRLGLMS